MACLCKTFAEQAGNLACSFYWYHHISIAAIQCVPRSTAPASKVIPLIAVSAGSWPESELLSSSQWRAEIKQHSYIICASRLTLFSCCLTGSVKMAHPHFHLLLHFLSAPLPPTPQLRFSPLAHSQDSCSNIAISAPRPQMWGNAYPFIATSNLKVRDNSSASHTLQQSMLHTSKCLRPFSFLSEVIAIDQSSQILHPKLWNLSKTLVVQFSHWINSCSSPLLYLWRMLFQQEMQRAVDFPEVLVWARLPSPFLLQDSKQSKAFP